MKLFDVKVGILWRYVMMEIQLFSPQTLESVWEVRWKYATTGDIINVCSVADTWDCYFHLCFCFFSFKYPSSSHDPSEQPVSLYSYSLIFAAFCVYVCWNDCPTFENATSTLLLFVKSIWSSVKAIPPTARTLLFELSVPSVWTL